MRTALPFILAFAAVGIVGCDSGDDGNDGSDQAITEWQGTFRGVAETRIDTVLRQNRAATIFVSSEGELSCSAIDTGTIFYEPVVGNPTLIDDSFRWTSGTDQFTGTIMLSKAGDQITGSCLRDKLAEDSTWVFEVGITNMTVTRE